ncbi:CCA tRNA nucleotidyltransferase [Alteribacter populi]|uniref:CCA tRNA nucleotidyltransferase n=1 Tax=Alteribacter populi TaxID=2011011 RepID=UPI000BBB481B|nr:CCA tRNA nucleotidyltransferase [Alteribacter populi]
MQKELWTIANKVIASLAEHGFEAYIVGGAVRDWLLNDPIVDVDIATNAFPENVKAIFSGTIDVGVTHGTVIVPIGGQTVEVTTFKGDGGRFGKTIKEDLTRRDFTMNAMAISNTDTLIDPFGGIQDLENGIIRSVGMAKERFEEDPIRMLRALRFAHTLGFQLDKKTEESIREHSLLIANVAVERIADEWRKMLVTPLKKHTFINLLASPLTDHLTAFPQKVKCLPVLRDYPYDFVISNENAFWFLASWSSCDSEVRAVLNHYKRSNRLIKDIMAMRQVVEGILKGGWTSETLYLARKGDLPFCEQIRALLKGEQACRSAVVTMRETLPIQAKSDLAVQGKDLINEFKINEGKRIGTMLNRIERAVVNGQVTNEKQSIFQYVREEERR